MEERKQSLSEVMSEVINALDNEFNSEFSSDKAVFSGKGYDSFEIKKENFHDIVVDEDNKTSIGFVDIDGPPRQFTLIEIWSAGEKRLLHASAAFGAPVIAVMDLSRRDPSISMSRRFFPPYLAVTTLPEEGGSEKPLRGSPAPASAPPARIVSMSRRL